MSVTRDIAKWKDPLAGRCSHQKMMPGKNERRREVSDYHYICNIDTSKDERHAKSIGDIYINACTCKRCREYIRSCNRHDFVQCGCGEIAVDGGSWYVKRSGNLDAMEEDIVLFNDARAMTNGQ